MATSGGKKSVSAYAANFVARRNHTIRLFLTEVLSEHQKGIPHLSTLEKIIARLTSVEGCRIEAKGVGYDWDQDGVKLKTGYLTWVKRRARYDLLKRIASQTDLVEQEWFALKQDLREPIDDLVVQYCGLANINIEKSNQLLLRKMSSGSEFFMVVWTSLSKLTELEVAGLKELLWLADWVASAFFTARESKTDQSGLEEIYELYDKLKLSQQELPNLDQILEPLNRVLHGNQGWERSEFAQIFEGWGIGERLGGERDGVMRFETALHDPLLEFDYRWARDSSINWLDWFRKVEPIPNLIKYVIIPSIIENRAEFQAVAKEKSSFKKRTWVVPLDQIDLEMLMSSRWVDQKYPKAILEDHRRAVSENLQKEEILFVIHGIRTRAEWMTWMEERVRKLSNGQIRVVPIRYGYFDEFRFWAPPWFGFRLSPITKVERQIRVHQELFPGTALSVVAHSFGTFIVGNLLKSHPENLVFRRIFLLGSVLEREWSWSGLKNAPDCVFNDYSGRDYWPVLARCLSWGYGESGTFGFIETSHKVMNREHHVNHSDYCKPSFQEAFLFPLLCENASDTRISMAEFPAKAGIRGYVLSWLGNLPLRLLMKLLAFLLLIVFLGMVVVSSLIVIMIIFRIYEYFAKIANLIVSNFS